VRNEHDNRENNEVVEFRVAHQYYEIHVVNCLQPRGMIVTFGQTSGAIDPIAPVLPSQKGSLFLTRPVLFHYIERRDALEASASELFEVVASGKVRINVNQRFALEDAADAQKVLEARDLGLHHPDPLTAYLQESAMSKTAITSPELAPPVGPFSQAIEVGGFLYVSGQVGQDPATGRVVEGGIVAETERVFRNLSAVLKAAGRSFDHVARAAVYLTSMSDFAAMNGIYAKYFSQPFPARTTIAVAALPLGACVEIDLVVKA
jgi:2-iminobutanoate/2-iminopropanoate deaminase